MEMESHLRHNAISLMKTCLPLVSLLLLGMSLMACSVSVTWPMPNTPAAKPNVPRFADNTVFVHSRRAASGPYTLIGNATPARGHRSEGGVSSCGYPPFVTEVRWKFLQTTEFGDIYEFTRRLPAADGAEPQTQAKKVLYTGEEIIIFQDDSQKVGMTPTPTPATVGPYDAATVVTTITFGS